eukprot:4888730-Alexandrium_andersonii.AAC.1
MPQSPGLPPRVLPIGLAAAQGAAPAELHAAPVPGPVPAEGVARSGAPVAPQAAGALGVAFIADEPNALARTHLL